MKLVITVLSCKLCQGQLNVYLILLAISKIFVVPAFLEFENLVFVCFSFLFICSLPLLRLMSSKNVKLMHNIKWLTKKNGFTLKTNFLCLICFKRWNKIYHGSQRCLTKMVPLKKTKNCCYWLDNILNHSENLYIFLWITEPRLIFDLFNEIFCCQTASITWRQEVKLLLSYVLLKVKKLFILFFLPHISSASYLFHILQKFMIYTYSEKWWYDLCRDCEF